MKLLISGFEPFDRDLFNPSADFLNWIKAKQFNFDLETTLLPVSFEKSYSLLSAKIKRMEPTFIILTGYAKNRHCLTLEKIAINWINARIPDNDGNMPMNQKILIDSPDGIFTTLPIWDMHLASKNIGVESQISYSAGEYVCNSLFYQALVNAPCPVGFIHIPKSTNENSYESLFKGIEAMIYSLNK